MRIVAAVEICTDAKPGLGLSGAGLETGHELSQILTSEGPLEGSGGLLIAWLEIQECRFQLGQRNNVQRLRATGKELTSRHCTCIFQL